MSTKVKPEGTDDLEPQIATLFARYDANHDGQFCKEEVVTLLRDLQKSHNKVSWLRREVFALFVLVILSIAGSFGASILANHATKEFTHETAHHHEDHARMVDTSGRPVETAPMHFDGPSSLFDLRELNYTDLTKMNKVGFILNGTRHHYQVAGVLLNDNTGDVKLHTSMSGTHLTIFEDHIEFSQMNQPVRAFTTAERANSLRRRLPAVSVSVSVEETGSSRTTYDGMMLCLRSPTSGSCKKTKKFLLEIKVSGARL